MKISVITVTYNSENTIGETLASIDMQQCLSIEHIIVDGQSTDRTLDIVREHQRPWRKVISEADEGIYDAMNKGIYYATGDIIGFLNSDDCYADETILQQVSEAFGDPKIDACYADLVYVENMQEKKIVRYWKSRAYKKGLCLNGWMPAHPTFYVRRQVFETCGGFDTQFRRQADFEMALRFFERCRINATYVPKIWVYMRTGGVSNSSWLGVFKGNWEALRACWKNGYYVTPFFVLRKLLSRLPQFFNRPNTNNLR